VEELIEGSRGSFSVYIVADMMGVDIVAQLNGIHILLSNYFGTWSCAITEFDLASQACVLHNEICRQATNPSHAMEAYGGEQ